MPSEKQLKANRKNAQKSTGPKTPEGKAKSAQNATKHGLTATHNVIKGESQEEFDAHRQGFLDAFNPQTAVEHFLADHAASLAWRLKRANRIQNEIVSGMCLDMPFVAENRSCLYEEPSNHHPDLTLGAAINRDFRFRTILERFTLYEIRIHNAFIKCCKALGYPTRKKNTDPDILSHPCHLDRSPAPQGAGRSGEISPQHEKLLTYPPQVPNGQGDHNLSPRGSGVTKQTQSPIPENAAISMESELYNLCSHRLKPQTEPNNNPPGDTQTPARPAYRSGTRRY